MSEEKTWLKSFLTRMDISTVLVTVILSIGVYQMQAIKSDIQASNMRLDNHMASTAARFDTMIARIDSHGSRIDAANARIDDMHKEIMALIKSQCGRKQ